MTGGEGKVGWAMVVKGKDEEELWRRGGGRQSLRLQGGLGASG